MNKLLIENSLAEEVIGRAKTVLVSNEGPAITTSIIVRPIEDNKSARLVFTGSVKFDEKLIKHLDEIVLSHINEIFMMMEMPLKSFDISAQNIGAVSSNDSEFVVQGYSADVPIFLATLSAGLQLPINQSSLFTGHISSKEGDISQVKSLIENQK
jgi:predicted ATP-dependent protease